MELIRRFTSQHTEFKWAEEQGKALQEVKRLVTTAPVLSYYDPKAELELQCDASKKVSEQLSFRRVNQSHSLAEPSRKLSSDTPK